MIAWKTFLEHKITPYLKEMSYEVFWNTTRQRLYCCQKEKRKTFLQQSETFVSSKSMCWKKSRRKLWLLRDHEIRSRRENRVLGIFLSSAVFLFIYLFTVLKKDENADCSYSEHFVSWRIRWYNRVSFFHFFFFNFYFRLQYFVGKDVCLGGFVKDRIFKIFFFLSEVCI